MSASEMFAEALWTRPPSNTFLWLRSAATRWSSEYVGARLNDMPLLGTAGDGRGPFCGVWEADPRPDYPNNRRSVLNAGAKNDGRYG